MAVDNFVGSRNALPQQPIVSDRASNATPTRSAANTTANPTANKAANLLPRNTVINTTPPRIASDTLTTSNASNKGSVVPTSPSLREQIALAEKLSGKKSQFKTEEALQAYLTSLEKAKPQANYDKEGFLYSLGVAGVRGSGRTDRGILNAVREQPGYVPNDDNTGKTIWIQEELFKLADHNPELFLALTKITNPILEGKSRIQGKWKQPLDEVTPIPTNIPVRERYADVIATVKDRDDKFGNDFHGGIPSINDPTHPSYGTYTIARALGFDDATARRMGIMDMAIDDNTTHYGSTSPMPFGQVDRHFNLNRKGQDTRLIYAQEHLELAIKLARATAYEQAEVELGCGLHSLQDLFAHGQITPSVHAVLGQFPDDVDWNPIGFYEATGATVAYLSAYIRGIQGPSDAPPIVGG